MQVGKHVTSRSNWVQLSRRESLNSLICKGTRNKVFMESHNSSNERNVSFSISPFIDESSE